jgi:transcriptional regulator with XRE-family HTH domain
MSNMATLRKARGMTQADLAAAIGVKRSTLAMWETGENMPPTRYLPMIADVLGCSIDELLKYESA